MTSPDLRHTSTDDVADGAWQTSPWRHGSPEARRRIHFYPSGTKRSACGKSWLPKSAKPLDLETGTLDGKPEHRNRCKVCSFVQEAAAPVVIDGSPLLRLASKTGAVLDVEELKDLLREHSLVDCAVVRVNGMTGDAMKLSVVPGIVSAGAQARLLGWVAPVAKEVLLIDGRASDEQLLAALGPRLDEGE